jgi:hypothetical protein
MVRGQPLNGTTPGATKVLFDLGQWRIEQLAAWDYHQVDSGATLQRLAESEHFSNQSFSAISADRVSQFSRRDDPKPGGWAGMTSHEERKEPRGHADTGIENLLEFCLPPHTLRLAETVRRHARAR